MNGLRKCVGGRALAIVIASMSLVLTLGVTIRPAAAAVATPPHAGWVECRAFDGRVNIKATIAGYSTTRYEYVSWYPRLQVWSQNRWYNVDVPGYTEQWWTVTASRQWSQSMTFVIGPESGTQLLEGTYYRLVSYFHWSSNNYMTPAEVSQTCLLQGIVVNSSYPSRRGVRLPGSPTSLWKGIAMEGDRPRSRSRWGWPSRIPSACRRLTSIEFRGRLCCLRSCQPSSQPNLG